MTHVLVAHAPQEEARAKRVADKLTALGFEARQDDGAYRSLSPFERRKLAADIDKAACVIVLWSREGALAPALRAAAGRAKAAGKLTFARLDASAPPAGFGVARAINLSNWTGRGENRAWRRLVAGIAAAKPRARVQAAAAPAPVKTQTPLRAEARAKKKSGGGWAIGLLLFLLAAAGGAAGYYFFLYDGPPVF